MIFIILFCLTGYHDKHQVVRWFWEAVDSFPNESRLRLLQVCFPFIRQTNGQNLLHIYRTIY